MIKILELLTDGGSLAVLGRKVDDTWRYVIIANGSALAEQAGGARETPLATWEEVLATLERHSWRKLRARFVHPDFAKRVMAALKSGPAH